MRFGIGTGRDDRLTYVQRRFPVTSKVRAKESVKDYSSRQGTVIRIAKQLGYVVVEVQLENEPNTVKFSPEELDPL